MPWSWVQMFRDYGLFVFLMLLGLKLLRLHLDWCWTKWNWGLKLRSLYCSPLWSFAQVCLNWGFWTAAAVYAETPNLQPTTFLKHTAKLGVPVWLTGWLRRGRRGSSQKGTVFSLWSLVIFGCSSLLLLIWKFSESFFPKTSGVEENNHLCFKHFTV